MSGFSLKATMSISKVAALASTYALDLEGFLLIHVKKNDYLPIRL